MANVTFDWANKIIKINDDVTSLDVMQDLYTEWKKWVSTDDNAKYEPAFKVIWWDPTIGDNVITPYFYLINWWKVKLREWDYTLQINWILLVDWWWDPYLSTDNPHNVRLMAIVPIKTETLKVWSWLSTEEHDQLFGLDTTKLDVEVSSRASQITVEETRDWAKKTGSIRLN